MSLSTPSSTYRIATRKSPLALWQASWVQHLLQKQNIECDLLPLSTTGDNFLNVPLSALQLPKTETKLSTGKGLFLKEIQEALLRKEAHLAVHSLKDVPVETVADLYIGAYLPRGAPNDALLLSPLLAEELGLSANASFTVPIDYKDLLPLLQKSKILAEKGIGTTSLRRQLLVQYRWGPFPTPLLRGNINTRIERLKQNEFGAILLAQAGLERLGVWTKEPKDFCHTFSLPTDEFIPAPSQGVVAVELHQNAQHALSSAIQAINHSPTEKTVLYERKIQERFGGGCHMALGVFYKQDTDSIRIFYSPDSHAKNIQLWEEDAKSLKININP
jgi:hydroxymethylbilane synthase